MSLGRTLLLKIFNLILTMWKQSERKIKVEKQSTKQLVWALQNVSVLKVKKKGGGGGRHGSRIQTTKEA